jgi:hypothetical protein
LRRRLKKRAKRHRQAKGLFALAAMPPDVR